MTNAKQRLTAVTTEESNRMAYKEMRMSYYLAGTLIFYAVIIIGAITIQSVSIIFDFASAFAVSATAFVFPGMFYLKAVKRFGGERKKYTYMSYLYILLGGVNCVLGTTSTILSIIYPA